MKNKYWILIIVILILAFALTVKRSKTPSIGIGVVLPLSGDLAETGNDAKNGVMLAYNQRKDNLQNQYDFIFEDFKYESKTAALAFNKLATIDKVKAAISIWSVAAGPIAPLAEQHNLPHISIDNTPETLNYKNNILHYTMTDELGRKMAKELQKRDIKSVVILKQNYAWSKVYVDDFIKVLQETNIKVLDSLTFNPNENDYRLALRGAIEKDPDIYVFAVMGAAMEKMKRQLDQLGNTKPVTSLETFDYATHKDAFNDAWFVSLANPSIDIAKEYKKAYYKDIKPISAFTYNATNILLDIFEKEGADISTTEIIKAINNMGEIDTAFGKTIIKDNIIPTKATLKIIKNGTSGVIN